MKENFSLGRLVMTKADRRKGQRVLAVFLCFIFWAQCLIPAQAATVGEETIGELYEAAAQEETEEHVPSVDMELDNEIDEVTFNENEVEISDELQTDEILDEQSSSEIEIQTEEEEPDIEPIEETSDISVIQEDNEEVVGGERSRDTVLVLDGSASMSGVPMREMKEAALRFCEDVLKSENPGRIAIVKFEYRATKACDFTNDFSVLSSVISSFSASGGTNTTEGMELAYQLICESNAEIKNLVLMTDGEAESGKASDNGPYVSGPHYKYANALYNAVIPMHQKCNVYTMGFFHSLSTSSKEFLARVLIDIQNAGYYEVEDSDDLSFIFGEVADTISEENKEKEEKFIQVHKEFLDNEDYYTMLNGWDAANQMLTKYGKLFQNYLGWQLVTLNISDNPYDIVLADLVLSEDVANSQMKALDLHINNDLSQIINSFITLIDSDGSLDADTKSAIRKLIETSDMTDKTTFNLLNQRLTTLVSEDTLNKFFNLYADAQIVGKFMNRTQGMVNTVIELIKYSAVVQAFAETTDEFRQVLIAAAYTSGDTLMSASIIKYCSILTEQDASELIANRVLAEGTNQLWGLGKDLFGDTIKGGVQNLLLENLNLSAAGSAVASNVMAFIKGCEIGYDVGKSFCNMFFNSDDTANTFIIAYATAKLTVELKGALESCDHLFYQKGDYSSAKLFCEAFSLYSKAQIATVDSLITYLGAQQSAFLSNKEDYVSEMYRWLLFKVEWQGISCHEPNKIPDIYTGSRKKYITIACPTDVQILDANGNAMITIVNGTIVNTAEGVVAAVSNNVKHILLPSEQEYRVKITSTDNGNMHYGISSFQNDKLEEGVICHDIPLKHGTVFEGDISENQTTIEDAQLISDGKIINCETIELEADIVKKIEFNQKNQMIYKGKNKSLKISVIPSLVDITGIVWKSSNPSVATVSSKGVVKGLKKGKTVITATSESGAKAICSVTVKEIPGSKVKLSKSQISMYQGASYTLKASMTPKNTTDTLKWKSSNKKIVTVSSKGVITGVKKGTAYVYAQMSGGKKAACRVTVKGISSKTVKLKKSSIKLEQGKTYALKATVTPGKAIGTLKWTTSNKNIATVSAKGVVKGIAAGNATIIATATSGKKSKCKVQVVDYRVKKLALNEEFCSMDVGAEKQLVLSVLPTNAKESVKWKSSDPTIVSVDQSGKIKARNVGKVTITVSSSIAKTSCAVEVVQQVESVKLKQNVTLVTGMRYKLKTTVLPINATDQSISYSTDNQKVAIVSGNGVVKAKSPGNAVITARSKNGKTDTCSITVENETILPKSIILSAESIIVDVGKSASLAATISPEDADDKTILWSSSDTGIATVNNGAVTGKKVGKAVITASTVNGKTASCEVNVRDESPKEIKLDLTQAELGIGGTVALNASIMPDDKKEQITWSSSAPAIAKVSNTGIVTGVSAGNATITATAYNGISASCKITVKSFFVKIERDVYNCKIGDTLVVNATVYLERKITLNTFTNILYYAHAQGFSWNEIGSYDIDGSAYFKERWHCEAKLNNYKISGNIAQVTLTFNTSNMVKGSKLFAISVFPYDNFATGGSLYDCMFRVNFN